MKNIKFKEIAILIIIFSLNTILISPLLRRAILFVINLNLEINMIQVWPGTALILYLFIFGTDIEEFIALHLDILGKVLIIYATIYTIISFMYLFRFFGVY